MTSTIMLCKRTSIASFESIAKIRGIEQASDKKTNEEAGESERWPNKLISASKCMQNEELGQQQSTFLMMMMI